MKISVVTPMRNEMFFVKGWLKNVRSWADEIIVAVDPGSTDETYNYLMDNHVNAYRWNEPETWSYQWEEHLIRNELLERATSDYIFAMDVDELIHPEDMIRVTAHDFKLGRLRQVFFWGNPDQIRMPSLRPLVKRFNNHGRKYWGVLRNYRGMTGTYKTNVFSNTPDVRYLPTGNHCRPTYKNLPTSLAYRLPITRDINVYYHHYHFAFDVKKVGGNRADEMDVKNIRPFYGKHPIGFELYGK